MPKLGRRLNSSLNGVFETALASQHAVYRGGPLPPLQRYLLKANNLFAQRRILLGQIYDALAGKLDPSQPLLDLFSGTAEVPLALLMDRKIPKCELVDDGSSPNCQAASTELIRRQV